MIKIISTLTIIIGCLLELSQPACAQSAAVDTVRVGLDQVEQQFIEKNFLLLAQRYQIDAATAAIKQSKLWPNPNIFFESNMYNPNTGKFFSYAKNSAADIANSQYNNGEYNLQVSQLILLAGKRSKLVRLAESNRQLQVLAFDDLMRTLKFQLYTTYANLYYDVQSYRLLSTEEEKQKALVESFRILRAQGGASGYEVTRLEAELQSLLSDKTDLATQIADEQATLRILLQTREKVFLLPTDIPAVSDNLPSLSLAIDSALVNRPDVKTSVEQLRNAQRNLAVVKAQAVPDLTAGYAFDKYGSAYMNYSGFNLQMDLPFFNRNQGNIKMAKIGVESSKKGIDAQEVTAQTEVVNAYEKLQSYYQLRSNITPEYQQSLQNISTEAAQNYNRKTINLLDYLDKIRTYKQAQLNIINLQNNLFQTQQYFNYVTNTRFF